MVLVTILAVLGSVALLSIMQIGTLRRRLSTKEQELASMLAQNETLGQELRQLEQQHRELEKRLEDVRAQLTSATAERERIRTEMEALQARFKALQDESTRAQRQVEQLTKEKGDVTSQLQSVQKDRERAEQSAVKLRNRLAFLDRDYRQLEAAYMEMKTAAHGPAQSPAIARYAPMGNPATEAMAAPAAVGPSMTADSGAVPPLGPPATVAGAGRPSIELAPIVVRRAQAEVLRALQTRVVDLNEVHQFVVLGKGSEDGMQLGMQFEILRGGARVGQVVIIRVQPRLAAAEIITGKSTGLPQVGDLAIKME
jgi:F0F1-type ATP synthase membrane subunit b/b'